MKIILITTAMMVFNGYKKGGITIDTHMERFQTMGECKAVAQVFLKMPYGKNHLSGHDARIARSAECVDLTKVTSN